MARPEREKGKLTLRGSFSYIQPNDASGIGRGLATMAATMDCAAGSGTFYFRDALQRVELQSARFTFDANAVCLTDKQSLQALTDAFSTQVSGTYSPLRVNDSRAGGDGSFAMRLAGTDAAGVVLPLAIFCLAVQGGAYGHYALPRNARRPDGPEEGCTYLDSFTIQRSR